MTTLDVLKAARQRITDPKHWMQNALYCDESGVAQSDKSQCGILDAIRWCAQGALMYACDGSWWCPHRIKAAEELVGGRSLAVYNDTHTHAEVLALFDRTIARLEAAPHSTTRRNSLTVAHGTM